jgi:HlyD family secretion protein
MVLLYGVYVYHEVETNSIKVSKAVKVSRVKEEDIDEKIKLEGTVVPEITYNISGKWEYTIDEVLVDIGDQVKPGEVLVTFTKESIKKLQDEIEIKKVDQNNLKLELEDLDLGSSKLDLDSRLLEIEGIKKKIKILNRKGIVFQQELENLNKEAEVKINLLKEGGISAIAVNDLITRKSKKSIEVEDNEAELILMKQQFSLATMSYDRLKRELDMNRAKVIGKLKQHELNIKQLQNKLVENVKADMNGIVVGIEVENGNKTSEGEKIISLAPVGGNIVEVNIPIKILDAVENGSKARVISKNINGEHIYEAVIDKVSEVIEDFNIKTNRNQVVKSILKINKNNNLKSGSKVLVEIFGKIVNKVKVIDSFSVLEENDENYVFVIQENRARKKQVELGLKNLSKYQVLNLEVGDEIITNPFTVKVGDKVRRR